MVAREGGENRKALTILYTNAQSLIKKIDEMRVVAADKRPDVMTLTETWTNDTIENAFLNVDGYNLIERKDRSDTGGGRGGGILVYVRKELCAWSEKVTTNFNQCSCVKIKGSSNVLSLYTVYRSPNSTGANDALLYKWIEEMRGLFVIIGDFNFPGIEWKTGRCDKKGGEFVEVIDDNFLQQHVDEATQRSGNILDLVITNDPNLVSQVEMEGKLANSDHDIITTTINLETDAKNNNRRTRNYNNADYDEMKKMMRRNWEEELRNKDVEGSWQLIKGVIDEAVEKCVPWKKIRAGNPPKWMCNELKRLIGKKKRAWKKWKKSKKEEDRKEYKSLEKKTKKTIRNRKNAVEKRVAREAKSNPKLFFWYVNSSKQVRTKIGPLKDDDGNMIADAKRQAEILNCYFASVFTQSTTEVPTKTRYDGTKRLSDIDLNKEKVLGMLGKLKRRSAPGPDGITNEVLVQLNEELAEPLAILYRKSLDESKLPTDWKQSHVSPIFKNGARTEPGNYRPVNLTSNPCKGMEKMVNGELSEHLENNVLSNAQYGFRKGRSCQSNLIDFLETTTKWIDDGRAFDVLYLDFSKAFDKVCHKRLMVKLEAAGIEGKLLDWIKEWLAGRKQRVVVDGETSGWADVLSSVPQGTVLGGTLFNLYINDVAELIKSLIWKFADDTKLARIVETQEDADELQKDIDRLCEWARKWKMTFNREKCKILHVGRGNQMFEYKMDGVKLKPTEEEKDLGVWIESSMKPALQCETAAKKANQMLGLITRSFHFRTKASLVPLFKTFVRPKMEFSVAAWNPWLEKDIEVLEKVQKRLIQMLSDVKGESYEEKLKDAGLMTLKERRVRGDLIETFKTLKGFSNVDKRAWFTLADDNEHRPNTRLNTSVGPDGMARKKTEVLERERPRLEIRANFFTVRVVKQWNGLPEDVKNSRSVNAFKNSYDGWKRNKSNQAVSQ